MPADEWKLVTEYGLSPYPCGLVAGSKVRLRKDLAIRDHANQPTGRVHHRGEIWTVLSGVKEEPDVIWLQQADGERCTWDDKSFDEWFEVCG